MHRKLLLLKTAFAACVFAFAACSSAPPSAVCGTGGTEARETTGAETTVYCAYAIVIGGFRECPVGAPFRIPGTAQIQVCASRSGAIPGISTCLSLGYSCASGDGGTDSQVPRVCPITNPGVEATCAAADLGLVCNYDCDNNVRVEASCTASGWSTNESGVPANCVLREGVCCPVDDWPQPVRPGVRIGGWAANMAACQTNQTFDGCMIPYVDARGCRALRTASSSACNPWNARCPSDAAQLQRSCTDGLVGGAAGPIGYPVGLSCQYSCAQDGGASDGAVPDGGASDSVRAVCGADGNWSARSNCPLVSSGFACGNTFCSSTEVCVTPGGNQTARCAPTPARWDCLSGGACSLCGSGRAERNGVADIRCIAEQNGCSSCSADQVCMENCTGPTGGPHERTYTCLARASAENFCSNNNGTSACTFCASGRGIYRSESDRVVCMCP